PVLLNGIPVRLDALQSQRGDSFDCPNEVVLTAPDGAGGAEKNVGIDWVERFMRNRAPQPAWPRHRGGSYAGQYERGRNKLPPSEPGLTHIHRDRSLPLSKISRPSHPDPMPLPVSG